MLAPLEVLEQLKARLRQTVGQLPLTRDRGLVSLVLGLPEAPAHAPHLPGRGFQFVQARREEIRAGYGVAAEWTAQGGQRLDALAAQARSLKGAWLQADPDETGFTGLGLFGFAASPEDAVGDVPNALIRVPEVALRVQCGESALVLTTRLPRPRVELIERWEAALDRIVPGLMRPPPAPLTPAHLHRGLSQPDREDWQSLVGSALASIAEGAFEKVVLTRRQRLEGRRAFDVDRLIAALSYLFPSCQVIHLALGAGSFIAATPERLFSQREHHVEVDAIAGTAGRAADTERDNRLTKDLQSSAKDLHEHRLVAQAIHDALRHVGTRIEVPHAPLVMQLNNAQHLWTPIRAELKPDVDVFDLAALLHPTPATNGHPRQRAGEWLRREEPIERGWYTGAAGILEPDLTGDMWVLLRCALIAGQSADLYAGAGIVTGSDPLSEWHETEDKLAAMATALQFA